MNTEGVSLSRATIANVDAFLKHVATRGMVRVSLYDAAATLRRFFRDAHQEGWCRRDVAAKVDLAGLRRVAAFDLGGLL